MPDENPEHGTGDPDHRTDDADRDALTTNSADPVPDTVTVTNAGLSEGVR